MEPIVTGALIGAGASLLGGLMGKKSKESEVAKSIAFQREFAQHGLRWKMEDAQRAGVHPVYAMGAAPASGGAIPIMEDPLGRAVSDAGQQIGRAVGAQETEVQRAQRHVALQLSNASYAKDMAMANYYNSLAARAQQEDTQSAPMPDPVTLHDPFAGARLSGVGSGANRVKVEPSVVTSYSGSDRSVAAGVDSMWKMFEVGGRRWLLPNASNAGEALEAVSESWPLTAVVIRENMRRNPNFLKENADLIPFGSTVAEVQDLWRQLTRERAKSSDYRWGGDVYRWRSGRSGVNVHRSP